MSDKAHDRQWAKPDMADLVFLTAAVVVFLSARGKLLSDPGLGWHLRNIDAMRAAGSWLTVDPFSGPRGGQPWYTNQWLGELPLWLGERWAGLEGIAAVASLIVALTLRCLYQMLRSDGLVWPAAVLWTCLAAAATSCAWVARPNLFTLLFVLITARVCERVHTDGCSWRRAFCLVPMFAAWANIHGGFVAGLVLIAIATTVEGLLTLFAPDAVARSVAAAKLVRFGLLLLGCFAATLANPYGFYLYPWIFRLLGDRYFMTLHVEWKSPLFHAPGSFQFELLILLFPLLLALSKRRPNPVELTQSLVLFHFALTGLRYLPLWALTVTPLLARSAAEVPALEALGDRLRKRGDLGSLRRQGVSGWSWISSLALGAALLAASKTAEGRFAALLPEVVPTAALDNLVLLTAGKPNRVVFHSYDWGGYLTWRGWRPEGPSFRNWIDDRNEVQGEAHVRRYFAILAAEPGWERDLDAAKVEFVCIEPQSPLAYRLSERSDWRERYRDGNAVIFERLGAD